MTFAQLLDRFFAPPQPADFDVYPLEYAPEVGDTAICIARDATCTVDAIGYPYLDNVERYYVTGDGWTAWLAIDELF